MIKWPLFSLIAMLAVAQLGHAQQNLGAFKFADSQSPLEIYAQKGITWDRKKRLFIASGQAQARSGQRVIESESLTAHYRDSANEAIDIWLIEAEMDVRISLVGGEQARSEHARYEVDSGIAVLWGGKPQLISDADIIGARDRLVYNSQTLSAQAVGQAYARRHDRILTADQLDVRFRRDSEGQLHTDFINAVGSVCIQQGASLILAEQGDYHVDKGLVTLRNSVQLWQGNNFLRGERAEANLNTGFSRILPGENHVQGRVTGILPKAGKQQSQPKAGCN